MMNIIKIILMILFYGFCLLNIICKFKPVISLFLFFKDYIKMDKSKFRGYGFWLYCGLGGSGKTLSMVEYMARMKKKYPKIKIYTNFNFKLSDGRIDSWKDIINLDNGDNGIIFGFDEIHLTFASQNWKDCPDNMLDYISQQRKLHKQIVASSQVFTRIDKKLREQTNYVIECSSLFMGRWIFNKYYRTEEYLANDEKGDAGARKRKRSRRYSFIAYDYIRNKYDTMQLMKQLTPKSKKQIQFEELTKKVKENIQ